MYMKLRSDFMSNKYKKILEASFVIKEIEKVYRLVRFQLKVVLTSQKPHLYRERMESKAY